MRIQRAGLFRLFSDVALVLGLVGGGPAVAAAQTWPTAATTGVPAGTTLTTVSSATLSRTGQILDSKLVTGDVIVTGKNVLIKNSEIRGRVYNSGGGGFTIQDSTVGPTSGCSNIEAIGYSNYTATRVRLHNVGDGFRVSGDNVLVQDSLVVLCSNPGDHSDGVQGYGGGNNVVISHNTIDQRGAQDVTAPVFFADSSRSAVVRNNLLAGGGYSLRLHDDFNPDVGPWEATGNRIVKDAWSFGPVLMTNTNCATTTWSNNRLVTIDSNYNILTVGDTVNCSGSTSTAPPPAVPGPPSNLHIS